MRSEPKIPHYNYRINWHLPPYPYLLAYKPPLYGNASLRRGLVEEGVADNNLLPSSVQGKGISPTNVVQFYIT
jgi:hypothetical protein